MAAAPYVVKLPDVPADASFIDVSWHMPNSPRDARKEFLERRIPNARFLDLDEVASPSEMGLKHMMPPGEVFAGYCERAGLSPSSRVILYDRNGVFSSPRALFMFRAFGHQNSSILDGGLPAWQSHDHPTETASDPTHTPEPSVYPPPVLDESFIRSYNQIVSNSTICDSDASELVLDARSRGRFLGTDPEPRPGLSSGHIPNSYSLPFNLFLSQTKSADGGSVYTSLRSPAEMLEELKSAVGGDETRAILDGKRQVVASCGSGMTAGVIWLGLSVLGVRQVGLYDESWTGYAMRTESKINHGEQ